MSHVSLQEPGPFLTAIPPEVCCWEGGGSVFAIGWCGWVWESPVCDPSDPSRPSACSPTLPILYPFVVLFTFIAIFPRSEEAPGGDVGHRCSHSALSRVAAAVLCFPKGRQQQTLARSVLTKVWQTSGAEQCLITPCSRGMLRMPEPWSWLAVRVEDVLTWLAQGAHGASESPATELREPLGSGSSSCSAAIWSALVQRSCCPETREGKAWELRPSNNAMQQEHVNLSAGKSGDDQGKEEPSGFFIFCNEALNKMIFFPTLHTLERGREGPPTLYEKVTFKKTNSLEAKELVFLLLFGLLCRFFHCFFFFFCNKVAQYLIFCRTNNFCFLCYEILETVLNFKESKHFSAEKTQQKSSLSCPL